MIAIPENKLILEWKGRRKKARLHEAGEGQTVDEIR